MPRGAKTRIAIPGVARRQKLPAAREKGPARARGASATRPRGAQGLRRSPDIATASPRPSSPCKHRIVNRYAQATRKTSHRFTRAAGGDKRGGSPRQPGKHCRAAPRQRLSSDVTSLKNRSGDVTSSSAAERTVCRSVQWTVCRLHSRECWTSRASCTWGSAATSVECRRCGAFAIGRT